MDGLDTALAPGCYGMSMCFKEGSTECGTCPFAATCKPLGEQQLAMMRAELGIKPPVVKPREVRPARVSPGMQMSVGLPKKVAAWVDYIEKAQISVTEALRNRVNPFIGRRPQFLTVACHLLLNCEAGVSRQTLKYAFMKKLNWSEDTTEAHITQTRQILTAVGAIDSVDGVMRLRAQ
jgi:hypothetical protein